MVPSQASTRLQTRSSSRNQIETSDDIVSRNRPAALEQDENRLPFDPASLPTIESIGAESNIRAFLEAGVPDDLTRAALRRAWSLDPAIRDFVGLSENSWDFNAPGAMAGFGPIDGEEVGRLLTRLLGEPDTIATAVHPSVISPLAENSQASRRIRSGRASSNQRGIDGAGIRQRSEVGLRRDRRRQRRDATGRSGCSAI